MGYVSMNEDIDERKGDTSNRYRLTDTDALLSNTPPKSRLKSCDKNVMYSAIKEDIDESKINTTNRCNLIDSDTLLSNNPPKRIKYFDGRFVIGESCECLKCLKIDIDNIKKYLSLLKINCDKLESKNRLLIAKNEELKAQIEKLYFELEEEKEKRINVGKIKNPGLEIMRLSRKPGAEKNSTYSKNPFPKKKIQLEEKVVSNEYNNADINTENREYLKIKKIKLNKICRKVNQRYASLASETSLLFKINAKLTVDRIQVLALLKKEKQERINAEHKLYSYRMKHWY